MCSEDQWSSYGFGTTRGWVINGIIFIFGWTIPLTIPRLSLKWPQLESIMINNNNPLGLYILDHSPSHRISACLIFGHQPLSTCLLFFFFFVFPWRNQPVIFDFFSTLHPSQYPLSSHTCVLSGHASLTTHYWNGPWGSVIFQSASICFASLGKWCLGNSLILASYSIASLPSLFRSIRWLSPLLVKTAEVKWPISDPIYP